MWKSKLELPGDIQNLNSQYKNHHQLELLKDLDRSQARLGSGLGS
jgi:DNA-binding transcriptional regulator YbjK